MNNDITIDKLEHSEYWIKNTKESSYFSRMYPDTVVYESNDNLIKYRGNNRWNYHITISNISNHPEYPWSIHVDDLKSRVSVAGFEVKDIRHMQHMLEPYNIHISGDMDYVCWLAPSWDGDNIMARHALWVMKDYVRTTKCHPNEVTWKEWHRILGHIIFALEFWADDCQIDRTDKWLNWHKERYPERWMFRWTSFMQRVYDGMELYGKYFGHFSW